MFPPHSTNDVEPDVITARISAKQAERLEAVSQRRQEKQGRQAGEERHLRLDTTASTWRRGSDQRAFGPMTGMTVPNGSNVGMTRSSLSPSRASSSPGDVEYPMDIRGGSVGTSRAHNVDPRSAGMEMGPFAGFASGSQKRRRPHLGDHHHGSPSPLDSQSDWTDSQEHRMAMNPDGSFIQMCTSCKKSGLDRCWPQPGSWNSVRERRACQRCASKKAKCSLDRFRYYNTSQTGSREFVAVGGSDEGEQLKSRVDAIETRLGSLENIIEGLARKLDRLQPNTGQSSR